MTPPTLVTGALPEKLVVSRNGQNVYAADNVFTHLATTGTVTLTV